MAIYGILWSIVAFWIQLVKSAEVKCCSELFVSGGYEFREKSKVIDLSKSFQRDGVQLPEFGRYYHSHVVYRGEIYLLGGFSIKGPTRDVHRVSDPKRVSWKKVFPMQRARGFFQAVVFQDRIWACAGKNETMFIRECESYAPEDGWRPEPDMMESRFDHSAAVTVHGMYLFGSKAGKRAYGSSGQTAYSTEYFPAAPQGGADGGSFNPKWSPGPELPEPLYGVSTAVFNDNIYVFGGLHINSRRNCAYNLARNL